MVFGERAASGVGTARLVIFGAPSDDVQDFFVYGLPFAAAAGEQRAGDDVPCGRVAGGTSARFGGQLCGRAAGNGVSAVFADEVVGGHSKNHLPQEAS